MNKSFYLAPLRSSSDPSLFLLAVGFFVGALSCVRALALHRYATSGPIVVRSTHRENSREVFEATATEARESTAVSAFVGAPKSTRWAYSKPRHWLPVLYRLKARQSASSGVFELARACV